MSRLDRSQLPIPGPAGPFVFPRIERRRLANGLEVRVISHRSVPVASMVLLVPGGSASDDVERPGLVSLLADLLDEGSRGMSALEVSDRIARIGGDLDVDVNHDSTVVSLTTLDRFLETGLSLVHEISTAPNLTDADFTRVRQLRLERLRQLRDHPGALADRSFAKVIYQTHPYALPGYGTGESLAAITVDEVRTRHARMFQPEGATLVLAGDRPASELLAAAEAVFGSWTNDRAVAPIPRDAGRLDPPRTPAARLGIVSRPGSAQSELRVGHVAASRATPDYHAIILLNAVLGGQFVSRLNMNLREDKGYTYGVRTGFDLRRGWGRSCCRPVSAATSPCRRCASRCASSPTSAGRGRSRRTSWRWRSPRSRSVIRAGSRRCSRSRGRWRSWRCTSCRIPTSRTSCRRC